MALQFMWRKDLLLHETCLEETLCFLLMFLTGFSSLSVLLLFPLLIAFIFFRYSFLFLELSISNDLTQMVTWILTVTLTVLLIWIFFFFLTLVFVLHWLSLHWETLTMLLSLFPLTLRQTQNGMSCFPA